MYKNVQITSTYRKFGISNVVICVSYVSKPEKYMKMKMKTNQSTNNCLLQVNVHLETSLIGRKWKINILLRHCKRDLRIAKTLDLKPIESVVKSLEKGLNCACDHSLRKLSIKSSLARHTLEPILKVGWNFWDPSSHLSNFERIIGSKIRYVHGTRHLKSQINLCKG